MVIFHSHRIQKACADMLSIFKNGGNATGNIVFSKPKVYSKSGNWQSGTFYATMNYTVTEEKQIIIRTSLSYVSGYPPTNVINTMAINGESLFDTSDILTRETFINVKSGDVITAKVGGKCASNDTYSIELYK